VVPILIFSCLRASHKRPFTVFVGRPSMRSVNAMNCNCTSYQQLWKNARRRRQGSGASAVAKHLLPVPEQSMVTCWQPKAPPKDIVNTVCSYFSGHYQCYGVNVQAECDHLSRFTYIAVAGPGVMNDSIAIHEVDIGEIIEMLQFGFCVIGDCAYNATEHLIPLFSGADKLKLKLDDFNFFGSQLRIRIKMAFGMMQ
jgi:DDE superfamily endonuclease